MEIFFLVWGFVALAAIYLAVVAECGGGPLHETRGIVAWRRARRLTEAAGSPWLEGLVIVAACLLWPVTLAATAFARNR